MVKADEKDTFWSRAKAAIEAQKGKTVTQPAAAKEFGVTQATISGTWNKPGKGPEIATGIKLAKRLGVCVEWLYTGRGPKHPGTALDEHAEQLLSVWPQLEDGDKRAIAGYAFGRASRIGDDSPFAKPRVATQRPTKATS